MPYEKGDSGWERRSFRWKPEDLEVTALQARSKINFIQRVATDTQLFTAFAFHAGYASLVAEISALRQEMFPEEHHESQLMDEESDYNAEKAKKIAERIERGARNYGEKIGPLLAAHATISRAADLNPIPE